jgi:hypothetical protein
MLCLYIRRVSLSVDDAPAALFDRGVKVETDMLGITGLYVKRSNVHSLFSFVFQEVWRRRK